MLSSVILCFAMSSSDETISCRICLGDKSDGRFISPCRCNGTMKYVHDHCLQQWRASSKNHQSFFQCDLCKYRYSFRYSWLVNLFQNNYFIYLITLLLFFSTCVMCIYMLQCSGFITLYKEKSLLMSISIVFQLIVIGPYHKGVFFLILLCKIGLGYLFYNIYKLTNAIMDHIVSRNEYMVENSS